MAAGFLAGGYEHIAPLLDALDFPFQDPQFGRIAFVVR
jgi:hypothetical protein